MRVVTKAIYVAMENGYFGTMMYIESKLEGKVFSSEETKIEKQVWTDIYRRINVFYSRQWEIQWMQNRVVIQVMTTMKRIESERKNYTSSNWTRFRIREELMQNFTIRSLAKFMTSNRDVYNGDYGRVEFRKSDLWRFPSLRHIQLTSNAFLYYRCVEYVFYWLYIVCTRDYHRLHFEVMITRYREFFYFDGNKLTSSLHFLQH